jgi:membrane-associated protein
VHLTLLAAAEVPEWAIPYVDWVQTNVEWAPWIIFWLLILAGFNFPISEDLMLFASAYLAATHDPLFWHLFLGVFLGAYLSDLICYGLGRFFGEQIWKVKFLSKMISRKRMLKIQSYYEKHGGLTLLIGRFIPFGVRNGLFTTAGMGKMNFIKFAMYDLVACSISVVFFFTLYYKFGVWMLDMVLSYQKYVFLAAVVIAVLLIYRSKGKKIVAENDENEPKDDTIND